MGMLFQTTLPVPKNHQLVMMYAESEKATEGFFKERGLTRCDVWTKEYPTILKKKATPKNLVTTPALAQAAEKAREAAKSKLQKKVASAKNIKAKAASSSKKTKNTKKGAGAKNAASSAAGKMKGKTVKKLGGKTKSKCGVVLNLLYILEICITYNFYNIAVATQGIF